MKLFYFLRFVSLFGLIMDVICAVSLVYLLVAIYPLINGGILSFCYTSSIWWAWCGAVYVAKSVLFQLRASYRKRVVIEDFSLPEDWEDSDREISDLLNKIDTQSCPTNQLQPNKPDKKD